MATKYELQTLEGEVLKSVSKKQAAIEAAEKQDLAGFRIVTDKGTVVHEVLPEAPTPIEVETEDEPVFYESIDLPGNYSIVTAPLAVEIAEAAGVPTKVETFKGKLTRKVHFGGTDVPRAGAVAALVRETVEEAHAALKVWQKENLESRRGLTDMERFYQHREFIAKHGHKVAQQVKKGEVL